MFLRELASCYALSERTKIYPATLIKKRGVLQLTDMEQMAAFF